MLTIILTYILPNKENTQTQLRLTRSTKINKSKTWSWHTDNLNDTDHIRIDTKIVTQQTTVTGMVISAR